MRGEGSGSRPDVLESDGERARREIYYMNLWGPGMESYKSLEFILRMQGCHGSVLNGMGRHQICVWGGVGKRLE